MKDERILGVFYCDLPKNFHIWVFLLLLSDFLLPPFSTLQPFFLLVIYCIVLGFGRHPFGPRLEYGILKVFRPS